MEFYYLEGLTLLLITKGEPSHQSWKTILMGRYVIGATV